MYTGLISRNAQNVRVQVVDRHYRPVREFALARRGRMTPEADVKLQALRAFPEIKFKG
jgi:hypothetical protein